MPQSASMQMSTPQSAPTNTPQPGRLCSHLTMDLFNRPQAMLIDQDIVPSHRVQPPSVLQPVYKRLLPHDIVRLAAGKDLIIVILAIKVVKHITFIPRSFVGYRENMRTHQSGASCFSGRGSSCQTCTTTQQRRYFCNFVSELLIIQSEVILNQKLSTVNRWICTGNKVLESMSLYVDIQLKRLCYFNLNTLRSWRYINSHRMTPTSMREYHLQLQPTLAIW
jgi:hypothetical protein